MLPGFLLFLYLYTVHVISCKEHVPEYYRELMTVQVYIFSLSDTHRFNERSFFNNARFLSSIGLDGRAVNNHLKNGGGNDKTVCN